MTADQKRPRADGAVSGAGRQGSSRPGRAGRLYRRTGRRSRHHSTVRLAGQRGGSRLHRCRAGRVSPWTSRRRAGGAARWAGAPWGPAASRVSGRLARRHRRHRIRRWHRRLGRYGVRPHSRPLPQALPGVSPGFGPGRHESEVRTPAGAAAGGGIAPRTAAAPQVAAGPPASAAPPAPSPRTRRAALVQRLRLLLVAGVAVPLAMALVGGGLAFILRRESLLAELLGPQPWPRILLWALVGMAFSLGVTTGLAQIWDGFAEGLERAGLETGDEVLRLAGWPVLAVVVVGAGLGEELLFRGALQPTLGVLVTSLLFGLAHGGWRFKEMWSYVLSAALAGLAFGVIYQRTGLLWAAILAHAGHNLLVTFYLLHRRQRPSSGQA